MKKYSKIIMIMVVFAIAITPMFSTVFGGSQGVPTGFPSGSSASGQIMDMVSTGWGLVLSICQIAAFAIIIFCGLKYMFASASEKADLKKSMVPLLIGGILVFGSTFIVQIVMAIVGTFSGATQ